MRVQNVHATMLKVRVHMVFNGVHIHVSFYVRPADMGLQVSSLHRAPFVDGRQSSYSAVALAAFCQSGLF